MTLTVVLPWPSPALSSNARVHHMALARAKKAYRQACAWQAIAQGARAIKADSLKVHVTFFRPDRRTYDKDNLIGRFKAGQDGLADVLKVDDGLWDVTHEIAEDIGGMVRIQVEAVNA